jgi:hypothetical protein
MALRMLMQKPVKYLFCGRTLCDSKHNFAVVNDWLIHLRRENENFEHLSLGLLLLLFRETADVVCLLIK